MLKGNRKLAAIIAGLLVIGATAVLGAYYSVETTTVALAMTLEGTLAAGGIITFRGSD